MNPSGYRQDATSGTARDVVFTPNQSVVPTDLEWKSRQPSLSAAVGAVIEHAKKEPDMRSTETQ